MEKPISLKLKELKDNLVNEINESRLPMCILRPIIEDIYNQVVRVEQQEYTQDKNAYENSEKEKKEKKK